MSLSTLGQQLAAINDAPGGKKNLGSAYATSRRHEDAIGRGVAHSVQVGHSMPNKSYLYKPSIIYEDSKKASDVPLATIRENCIASLRQLEAIDSEFGTFITSLCNSNIQERGLLTEKENETIDKLIEDLLFRLSLRMSTNSTESSNNNLASCLHVIEYLLRKYDIHIRPKTASTVLLVMLPHHEEPYFLRLLQLIDLANMPEWTFLRPFATPQARVGRSVFAQQASKDVTLIRALCRLSQRNSKLPNCHQSLSFTAAVLVEALTIQTQRKGTMDERTCQALLPFVVAACRNNDNNRRIWLNWGHILASTMVETSVLAQEPRKLLVTSVLQGLLQEKQAWEKENKKMKKSPSFKELTQQLSNGMIVALTILAQEPSTSTTASLNCDDSSRLPILSSPVSLSTGNVSNARYYCGIAMDNDVLNVLLRIDDIDQKVDDIKASSDRPLANCLGHLYGTEGMTDFRNWIASILVVTWKRLMKHNKDKKDKTNGINRKLHLILTLMRQPSLEILWKNSNGQWIESYTSFVLLNMAFPVKMSSENEDDLSPNEKASLSSAKDILQALQSMDKVAYERGLTHALLNSKKKEDRIKLAKWLGLAKPKSISQDKNDNDAMEEDEDSAEAKLSISLPPRVALEHADSEVRLEAIPTLLEEAKAEDLNDTLEDGESIAQAFLRRFLIDDNENVALKAAIALDDLLNGMGTRFVNVIELNELGEGSLEGMFKWASNRNADEKVRSDLLVYGCRFASLASKVCIESGEMVKLLVRLMEGLGSFLMSQCKRVSEEAASSIADAWDGKAKSKKPDEVKKLALSFLVSKQTLLPGYRRSFQKNNTSELYIRRRLVPVLLEAFALPKPASASNLSDETFEYCIWLIDAFSAELSADEIEKLSHCLISGVGYLSSTPGALTSVLCRLASAEKTVFRNAVAPCIQEVCKDVKDKNSGKVSPQAVIMEAILSSENQLQIENLVSVTMELVHNDHIGCFYALAPTLALTCHSNESIRGIAVDLLSCIGKTLSSCPSKVEWKNMSEISGYLVENRSSVILGGSTFLPTAFATVLSNSNEADKIRKHLLTGILCSAAAYGSINHVSSDDYFASSWLDIGQVTGGYKTAVILLDAVESAGESSFPLLSRWSQLGESLLSSFLSARKDDEAKMTSYQSQLIFSIARMLKGVKSLNSTVQGGGSKSTIITSGPTLRGGRTRSYSFGKTDALHFLNPYPRTMHNAIISILTETEDSIVLQETRSALFDTVLSSSSWRREIFPRFSAATRQKIGSAILIAATDTLVENADEVLFSLPLDAQDISKILPSKGIDETELSNVTFVSDYVISNASKLAADEDVDVLFAAIFKQLSAFSKSKEDDESIQYTRQALLSALLELINNYLEIGTRDNELDKGKRFDGWMNSLVDVLRGDGTSEFHSVSLRMKRTIFSILAAFCTRFPAVVSKLVPIISALIRPGSSSSGEGNGLSVCLDLAVPVYFKHAAAASLAPADLFNSFIGDAMKYDKSSRSALYTAFIGALATIPQDEKDSPVGAFVAATLAGEIFMAAREENQTQDSSDFPDFVTLMFSGLDVPTKLSAVWTLLGYAKDSLFSVLNEEPTSTSDNIYSLEELLRVAYSGPSGMHNEIPSSSAIQKLCLHFLVATCNTVIDSELRYALKKSNGLSSEIILRMWQDLLLIQSSCHTRLGGSNKDEQAFLERTVEVAEQALVELQGCLPSHIFLAFITSLMKDGETEDLRSRAVQLIADRAASLDPTKPDAVLFGDMVPSLLELIDVRNSSDGAKHLHLSAFAAIDSIGRNICVSPKKDKEGDNQSQIFVEVLSRVSDVMETERNSEGNWPFAELSSTSRQLVCSAALCSSTAITICGPRAIPMLPKLLRSLLDYLSTASAYLVNRGDDDSEKEKRNTMEGFVMQSSFLRPLKSIIEKLSMFLKAHLTPLLVTLSEVAECVDEDPDSNSQPVRSDLEQLWKALAAKVPARQLIPSASKSISAISSKLSTQSILAVMTESIRTSKSSEVSGQINVVLKTAFHIFERDDVLEESSGLMDAADEMVISLVLKLSEVQLRTLYAKMRDWRGEVSQESTGAKQRILAFWNLSSALSKQLKSIYLPCLATVFSDAVSELVS